GGPQAQVGLGEGVADQVAVFAQPPLKGFKGVEQGGDGVVVGVLRGGEAGLVHAVVDLVVDGGVDGVDPVAQVVGAVVARPCAHAVEGAGEHADDVGGLVADDGLALGVPLGGHGDAAAVVRVGRGVDLVRAVVC